MSLSRCFASEITGHERFEGRYKVTVAFCSLSRYRADQSRAEKLADLFYERSAARLKLSGEKPRFVSRARHIESSVQDSLNRAGDKDGHS